MSSHNRQSFCPVPLMFKYNPKLFHFEKMVPSDKPYAACALRSVYVCAELFPLKSFKKKRTVKGAHASGSQPGSGSYFLKIQQFNH